MTRRERSSGQALVEFAILVPAFMIVLFGMLEFGFVFSHHLTLEYATREGARVGAALGNGTDEVPCTADPSVDEYIIAAVQRVLTSPGSQVPAGQVSEIRIYKATLSGSQAGGAANVWRPGAGAFVDGTQLKFQPTGGTGWPCTSRMKTTTATVDADSIGVSLVYNYQFITPLGALINIAGGQLTVSDRTVMSLNP